MVTTVKLGGLPIEKFSADHKKDEVTWRSWSDKLETVGSLPEFGYDIIMDPDFVTPAVGEPGHVEYKKLNKRLYVHMRMCRGYSGGDSPTVS